MKLVIAEKPSVGMSIAKVLKVNEKRDGYVEGNGYIVSWCVGQLIGLAKPEEYGEKYQKWTKEDLPIIPKTWQYNILEKTEKQFEILSGLMNSDRVETIICATDAGREGELIFRLVYMKSGCQKPVLRLWLSSMEDEAIAKAFTELKPGREYDNLYGAALCRQKADWIVGMSGTRLFSVTYNKLLSVGRVMTPTLAMIAVRDKSISSFVPESFYTIILLCLVPETIDPLCLTSRRFSAKVEAVKVSALLKDKPVRILDVKKEQKKLFPPKLYDLTTLQRDANRILGFSAQKTLNIAQSLYEQKFLTYPRTDSCYLTNDMRGMLPSLVSAAAAFLSMIDKPSMEGIGRVFNDSKVSDHDALLPTKQISKITVDLPAEEKSILSLVSFRLLMAVGEVGLSETIEVSAQCEGESFSTKGTTIITSGWKTIEGKMKMLFRRKASKNGTNIENDDMLIPRGIESCNGAFLSQTADPFVKEGKTTPPKPFTEDTLLSAMEHASEKEFAEIEDLERAGLGTPATRAATIEKLIKAGFIDRKGRILVATVKGQCLVDALPESIKSPSLTAEWEKKLKDVEKGRMTSEDFMSQIEDYISTLVASYQKDQALRFDSVDKVGICPRCGKAVIDTKNAFSCVDRNCGFAMWKNDRFFSDKQKTLTRNLAASLLAKDKVLIKGLYSKEKNKKYDAFVEIADTGRYVNYKLSFPSYPAQKSSQDNQESNKYQNRQRIRTR